MRLRITLAILGVVLGTLVLTVAGGLLYVHRAATTTAQNQLVPQVEALAQLLSSNGQVVDQQLLRVVKNVGSYTYMGTVGLTPSGQFSSLPSPLSATDLDPAALAAQKTVNGNVGDVVFVAVPVTLNARETLLRGIPAGDTAVLVVTRQVANPVSGIPYFLAVAGAVLVVASLVAALLARRISAPLARAAVATREVAGGDLSARVPVRSRDDPELRELATAINTLGESLERARGLERQFLLSVSHELRTPLTSIRGYADALSEGATDDVVGAAGVIASESRRLERLVQDLLELARLDARQFSLQMQRVDAAHIANAVLEGSKPEARNLQLELRNRVPTEAALWVDADPDRLAQVIANLIENAFKFANAAVEVGAASDGVSNILWVDDDGPGISPQDLPRVFERHFSSDRVPARRAGTGLGLAIVAQLAAAMGAGVRAESPLQSGRGTRMVVWMAARAEPDAESASPSLPTRSSPAPASNA